MSRYNKWNTSQASASIINRKLEHYEEIMTICKENGITDPVKRLKYFIKLEDWVRTYDPDTYETAIKDIEGGLQ